MPCLKIFLSLLQPCLAVLQKHGHFPLTENPLELAAILLGLDEGMDLV
jgi:hypothetical protein